MSEEVQGRVKDMVKQKVESIAGGPVVGYLLKNKEVRELITKDEQLKEEFITIVTEILENELQEYVESFASRDVLKDMHDDEINTNYFQMINKAVSKAFFNEEPENEEPKDEEPESKSFFGIFSFGRAPKISWNQAIEMIKNQFVVKQVGDPDDALSPDVMLSKFCEVSKGIFK